MFPFLESIGDADARSKLMRAAVCLLKDKGLEGLRVLEICTAADVSRTTFYREFENAEDIVTAVAGASWHRAMQVSIEEVQSIENPVLRWRTFFVKQILSAQNNSEESYSEKTALSVISLMYKDGGRRFFEVIEAISGTIERDQLSGILRSDISANGLSEWVMRQIWAWATIPPLDNSLSLEDIVEMFLLPAFLAAPARSPDLDQKLDEILSITRVLMNYHSGSV